MIKLSAIALAALTFPALAWSAGQVPDISNLMSGAPAFTCSMTIEIPSPPKIEFGNGGAPLITQPPPTLQTVPRLYQ